MPRILTDAYRDSRFFIPYTEDKSEGVTIKPQTETTMFKLRDEAGKEGGADESLSMSIFNRKLLQTCITDWVGFYDAAGNELPCTPEVIKELCECDPEFASGLLLRIRAVARIGILEEQKN